MAPAWRPHASRGPPLEPLPDRKTAARKKPSPAKKSAAVSSAKKGVSTTRNGAGMASSRKPGTTSRTASRSEDGGPEKAFTGQEVRGCFVGQKGCEHNQEWRRHGVLTQAGDHL